MRDNEQMPRVRPETPGLPRAVVLTAYVVLSPVTLFSPSGLLRNSDLSYPVGPNQVSPKPLDASIGRQDQTILPDEAAPWSFACSLIAHELETASPPQSRPAQGDAGRRCLRPT